MKVYTTLYKIKPRTYSIAEKLGVRIRASRRQGKKIDVLVPQKGKYIVIPIGQIGYYDYPTYLELEKQGKVERGTAMARKKAYEQRHRKDMKVANSAGFYAYMLLWT